MLKQIHPVLLKTFIWLVCSLIIIMSAASASGLETGVASSSLSAVGLTDQQFEDRVKQFIGIPYRRGGATTKGLDCSGFVRLIYNLIFGIDLPHSSAAQFRISSLKKIDRQDLQPGDLIFFGNKEEKRVNHVGVYLSDNRIIHATRSEGIKVSGLDESYWKKRFIGTRRHENLIADFSVDAIQKTQYLSLP